METDNHEIKDKLMITTSGLIGSQRAKKENNEDDSVYFGFKDPDNEAVIIFIIIFSLIIGCKY